MNPLQSILLGLTQGLTEFIPISSSGHLEIIQHLLGTNPENFHLFLQFINIGTLLALLIFFRRRIKTILTDIFRRRNYTLALNLIITSIPAALIGLLLAKFIQSAPFFASLYTVAIAMAAVGIIMLIIDRLPHLSKLKSESNLTKSRALTIGLAQILALIPGVSRSGATIITGRLMGLTSSAAANYSFLASIPLMCGVVLKTFITPSDRAYLIANLPTLALSNAIAFLSGLLALHILLKYLYKTNSLKTFGRYRITLASIILIILLIQI
jgi:undecaprenyl-diphosphatase